MDIISDADLYYHVVGRAATTRYSTLAFVMWLIYDWLLTLGDEIELIWSRDWTLAGKPMYLLVRYGGMLFQLYDLVQVMGMWDVKFCEIYFWLLPICTAILLYTMDLLLAYRVLCLYRIKRKLLWINVIAWLICVLSSAIIIGIAIPQYEIIPTPEFMSGCWAVSPPYDFTALVPGLVYELWLFGLLVAKVIGHARTHGANQMTGIFHTLVKDSSIWFFIIAGSILWNLIEVPASPRGLKGVVFPAFRTIVIICGCRLVLHLRKAYFLQRNGMTTQVLSTIAYHSETRTGAHKTEELQEEENARRAIKFAQRIGLPPVTDHDFGSWEADAGRGDHEMVSPPEFGQSDDPLPGHRNNKKQRKRKRRDLEEDGTDVEVAPEIMSDSPECFEMVKVRVDVESHAVVEETNGIGALTPRERRRLAASSRASGVKSRTEGDDSTEYESSSS